jgi:hypothetical protein
LAVLLLSTQAGKKVDPSNQGFFWGITRFFRLAKTALPVPKFLT